MIKKKHISPSYKFNRDDNLLFFFANSDSYNNKKQNIIKEAIDTLIAKKFGVNLQNSDGDTPLMVAIKTSNPYVASILLDKQVDITIKNHNGEDALSLAKTYHDTQTQKKLEQLIKDRI
jgi:ankyrin repeat protein